MTTETTAPATTTTDLERLRDALRGPVIGSDDEGYDAARAIWNGAIDRRFACVARCSGVADVVEAVRFARQRDLPVAGRSGGPGVGGHALCDGGLVIDLSGMKGIRVDPAARTVRAEAGVLWGELDRETQLHGLATVGGIVTHTGIAGLTLGGGIGWLMRKHGATVDNLVSVDLVTADGELINASGAENPELFWGVRGGGGNFGIVTSFEYRLHPVGPTVLAGPIFHHLDDAPNVLRFYRDFIADAPDELMTIVVHRRAPPLPFVPAELHGELVVGIASCYAGPVEDGEKVLRPLKRLGSPALDLCQPKPYVEHQAMFDPSFPHGWWYYIRACDVAELTDEVIDITVEHAMRIRSPLTTFPIWQMGGAVGRVADDATAFTSRSAGHTFNLTSVTEGPEGFEEE